MDMIKVKRLTANARIPERGSLGAAGFDLYAAHPKVIPARGRDCVLLDIEVNVQRHTSL